MFMILGIYGYKKSGKTALIENIISSLPDMKIAVIKHIPEKADFDKKGTDTFRYMEKGAEVSVGISENNVAFFCKNMELKNVIEKINDFDVFDLIIVEGFKHEKGFPKIAVGDIEKTENTVMKVENEKSVDKVVNFIQERITVEKTEKDKSSVSIKVNGKKVWTNKFIQKIFRNVVTGMVSALKNVELPKNIVVEIKNNGK